MAGTQAAGLRAFIGGGNAPAMPAGEPDTTERELREAFRLSGLWRDGWTFAKAIHTSAVYIALRATAKALRGKACPEQRRREQQKYGKPAPSQRAIF